MGTAAVIGLAEPGGGWRATYVGYEGDPESLGRTLLDLIVDVGGDLAAAWEIIARPSDGWRRAFSEAYEPGANMDYFDTGRGDSSLRGDDAFVRNSAVYWYVFDLEARTLEIRANTQTPPALYERIRFEDAGLVFEIGPEGPLDWRNRRASFGNDDPADTTAKLFARLDERLPITSKTVTVRGAGREAGLEREGFVFPLMLLLSELDAAQDDGVRLTDIVEHDLLFPRRVLSDRRRCEVALDAALDAITACVTEGWRPAYANVWIFPELFPFDLLALELDDAALRAAVRERVTACFESPRNE